MLARMEQCGLTARTDKCEFSKDKIEFFGYEVSASGVRPSEEKKRALKSCKKPQNSKEVESFLGLADWVLRKFVPQYSTIVKPLSSLTRKWCKWVWSEARENAFQMVMMLLEKQLSLYHFDPSLETKVYADASPVGLGAILCQIDEKGNERTIQCISRTLSSVERRYSQTEREALALVWACEKLHMYLYGTRFVLVTDHKALLCIYGNTKKSPPARILRWTIRLQEVEYINGNRNSADVLSRTPCLG